MLISRRRMPRLRRRAGRPPASGARGRGPRPALALLACAVPVLASSAASAVCVLQGSGGWGPIGSYTGPTQGTCSGAGGGPGPSEDVRIDAAATVRVVDSLTQNDAAVGITVDGSLSAEVSADALRLTVGRAGFDARSGSSVTLTGACRERGDPDGDGSHGETRAPCPPRDSENALWSVGDVIPCPTWNSALGWWEPDCDTGGSHRGHVFGLHYPDSRFNDPDGPSSLRFDRMIDRVVPPEDIVLFYDPDPTDADAPSETNFRYDVVDAEGSGGSGPDAARAYLHIDTRQGDTDSAHHSFRERDILQTTLAELRTAGERVVYVPPDTISADGERRGQWLRFRSNAGGPCPGEAGHPGAAPCAAAPRAYRIQRTVDDVSDGDAPACQSPNACDKLVLADLTDLPSHRAHAAGETVWLSVEGIAPGDPFYLQVPVRVSASGSGHAAGQTFQLFGSSSLENVVVERFEGAGAADDLYNETSTPQKAAWIWWRDLWSVGNSMKTHIDRPVSTVPLIGWSYTGATDAEESIGSFDHCLGIVTSDPSQTWEIEDYASRHCADDFIVFNPPLPAQAIVARRIRCEQTTGVLSSQECLSATQTRLDLRDGMCVDCSDDSAAFGSSVFGSVVLDTLVLASSGRPGSASPGLRFDNTTIVAQDATDGDGEFIAGGEWNGLSLRDSSIDGGSPSNRLIGGGDLDPLRVRRAWVRDNRIGPANVLNCATKTSEASCEFRDSAFVNNHRVDGIVAPSVIFGGTFTDDGPGADSLVLRNTIFAYTIDQDELGETVPGSTATSAGADAGLTVLLGNKGPEDVFELGGLVFANIAKSTTGDFAYWRRSGSADAPHFSGDGICFAQNGADARAEDLDAMGARGVLVLTGLGSFVAPEEGDFRPAEGTPAAQASCGPRERAGVCVRTWYHAVNRMSPECLASDCADAADNDGDGLVDGSDPGCSSEPELGEKSSQVVCDDGADNDGDGLIDFAQDPGCFHPAGSDEAPACDDGVDNDGDGSTDLDDPECSTPSGQQEAAPRGCGLGFELALLLPVVERLRSLRRRVLEAGPPRRV